MGEHDRDVDDELDDLLQVRPDTPLFRELMRSLERTPLPVDRVAADAAANRLLARLGGRRPASRLRLGLGLGLGIAAAAAAAVGVSIRPTGPPQEVDVSHTPAEEARAELPPAPPDVVRAVQGLMDGGDWLGAWDAAARVQLSEGDLRRLVTGLHTAWLGGDPATPEVAHAAYERYFAAFPAGPADGKMRWAYGELLYRAEHFADAYVQFLLVVDRHPDDEHARFCAESAARAALALADPDDPALDAWEERVIDAVDLYVAHWPDDPKRVALSYQAGHLLVTHERTEAALPHLVAVLTDAPDSAEAAYAADLLIDAWGDQAVDQAAASVDGLADDAAAVLLDEIAAALDEAGRVDDAAALRARLRGCKEFSVVAGGEKRVILVDERGNPCD